MQWGNLGSANAQALEAQLLDQLAGLAWFWIAKYTAATGLLVRLALGA